MHGTHLSFERDWISSYRDNAMVDSLLPTRSTGRRLGITTVCIATSQISMITVLTEGILCRSL